MSSRPLEEQSSLKSVESMQAPWRTDIKPFLESLLVDLTTDWARSANQFDSVFAFVIE